MSESRSDVLAQLQWHKFKVLDDGFVCLVDVMGDDSSVAQAARVSYGAGTRKVSDDRGLIRYLMRHRHTTPFEMCELKFLVRVPMDTWRQWVRHRTANINEYSTRYSEAIDSQQQTKAENWRLQTTGNRQGSDGYLDVDAGAELAHSEQLFHERAKKLYQHRLAVGIAREQARKDLPLSTYTEAYWKIDLHNLLHFLALRMDSHAQQEIREYATKIGNQIVQPLFPVVWEAFEDYVLNAVRLTGPEARILQECLKLFATTNGSIDSVICRELENERERKEAHEKVRKFMRVAGEEE